MSKITIWDILVAAGLLGFSLNGSSTAILLAVIAFFLWLLVRPRKATPAVAIPAETKPGCTPEQVENDSANGDEFPLDNGSISLNKDIEDRECKNHFRVHGHSPDWQHSSHSEYEYRLEGANVFVRELHCYSQFIIEPEIWKIRDGVVLETQLRGAGFNEDDITDLKQQTEWTNLPSTSWKGFKYVIISRNVPTPDARRLFRQEIERLKTGIAAFNKLGVEPDIEPLKKCGLSWKEFHSTDKLVDQLKGLLGEEQRKPNTNRP
jgi:hypothetical protein